MKKIYCVKVWFVMISIDLSEVVEFFTIEKKQLRKQTEMRNPLHFSRFWFLQRQSKLFNSKKMDEEIKKKRGGARPNSGRKKTSVKYYGFKAPQEVCDILENITNKSAYICEAILFYEKHKK